MIKKQQVKKQNNKIVNPKSKHYTKLAVIDFITTDIRYDQDDFIPIDFFDINSDDPYEVELTETQLNMLLQGNTNLHHLVLSYRELFDTIMDVQQSLLNIIQDSRSNNLEILTIDSQIQKASKDIVALKNQYQEVLSDHTKLKEHLENIKRSPTKFSIKKKPKPLNLAKQELSRAQEIIEVLRFENLDLCKELDRISDRNKLAQDYSQMLSMENETNLILNRFQFQLNSLKSTRVMNYLESKMAIGQENINRYSISNDSLNNSLLKNRNGSISDNNQLPKIY